MNGRVFIARINRAIDVMTGTPAGEPERRPLTDDDYQLAAAILRDEELRSRFEAGLLDVGDDVAEAFDRLVADRG